MTEIQQNGNDMLGKLTARLNELATCPEKEFNADHAIDAIEEAVGGSLASENHRAAIVDFSIEDIQHLEEVVKRFDQNPPALTDNADLELYTNLVEEARYLIGIRREQIVQEMKLGGRTARIEVQMSEQKNQQRRLFIDTAHNTLNAASELDRTKARRRA